MPVRLARWEMLCMSLPRLSVRNALEKRKKHGYPEEWVHRLQKVKYVLLAFLLLSCITGFYSKLQGDESMGCILHAYNRQTAEIYLHCGNSSADPDHGRNVYTGAFLLPVSLSYGSSICNYAGYTGSTFQTKSSKLCIKVYSL